MTPDQPPCTIGMVLFPSLTPLDLAGPYEVFARMPNVQVRLIAATPEPIRSDRGLTIMPDVTFAQAPPLDVLCVPGGPGVNALMENESFLAWLREQAEYARYVTAVCTGTLLLGAAGLLQGYRATTHWLSLDLLPLFGAQPVEERVVIDRNRVTGGGVTAGIDFGLVVAAQVCGEEIAREIQLILEYDPAPPFQSGSPRTADPALVTHVRHARQPMQNERRMLAERAAARLRYQEGQ